MARVDPPGAQAVQCLPAPRTPLPSNDLEREQTLHAHANGRRHCTLWWVWLVQCDLRNGLAKAGRFCIAPLAGASKVGVNHGLFFRGFESLPFGEAIRPARGRLQYRRHGVGCVEARAA